MTTQIQTQLYNGVDEMFGEMQNILQEEQEDVVQDADKPLEVEEID